MKHLKTLMYLMLVGLMTMVTAHTAQAAAKPSVVVAQLYADWCGTCKKLAPDISELKKAYVDADVLFVTFDRTDEQTSRSSEMLASALGMGKLYNKHEGTGKLLVVNAKNKKLLGKINKTHTYKDMSHIIDSAIDGKSTLDEYDKGSTKGSPKKKMKGSGYEHKGSY